MHLDQVLLARQSMSMPHQHDDVDAGQPPKVDVRIVAHIGHGDTAQGHLHLLVPRHSASPPSSWPGQDSPTTAIAVSRRPVIAGQTPGHHPRR
jgi:hypothetical protein